MGKGMAMGTYYYTDRFFPENFHAIPCFVVDCAPDDGKCF